MKTIVPPIKSQGIKTKLADWINSNVEPLEYDRWVEPFMGTGVVAFNIRPKRALLCDSNPHLIRFYNAVKTKEITSTIVKNFLVKEGEKLLNTEGAYYYTVRDRFNDKGNPLDFLFLSRSCFNGMMRFNKKGGFNVPFCKKPNRFAQALITKISNQVERVSQIIANGDFQFIHQDYKQTFQSVNSNDLIYLDPPYIGRHVDYFDSWTLEDELFLNTCLSQLNSTFILSTWLSNKYRFNDYIFTIWKDCFIATKEHFYHVGGKELNRNAVYEAILSNVQLKDSISNQQMKMRIDKGQSLLTSSLKKHLRPKQLSFKLE